MSTVLMAWLAFDLAVLGVVVRAAAPTSAVLQGSDDLRDQSRR